jgi:hypothetical protein
MARIEHDILLDIRKAYREGGDLTALLSELGRRVSKEEVDTLLNNANIPNHYPRQQP